MLATRFDVSCLEDLAGTKHDERRIFDRSQLGSGHLRCHSSRQDLAVVRPSQLTRSGTCFTSPLMHGSYEFER